MQRFLTFLMFGCGLIALTIKAHPGNAAQFKPEAKTYRDMILDEGRGRIYATSSLDLFVYDTETLEVLQTLSLGGNQGGLDISPDGSELAVAVFGFNQIVFIDLDTLTITKRLNLKEVEGGDPAWDLLYGRPGRLFCVPNPDKDSESTEFGYIRIIDAQQKVELGIDDQPLYGTIRLAMTADRNTLYAAESDVENAHIYRMDASNDDLTVTAGNQQYSGQPFDITVTPEGDRVFLGNGTVWKGDLSEMLVETYSYGNEVAYSPALQRFYLTSLGGDWLHIFSSETYQRIISVGFNQPGPVRVDSAGSQLYISTSDGIKMFPADLTPQPVYLPLTNKVSPPVGIYGRITNDGLPINYPDPDKTVCVELRWFDGTAWYTRKTACTDDSSRYHFNVASLLPGQAYYVRYINISDESQICYWHTRYLESYTTGTSVNLGNFDVQNIELLSPEPGAYVAKPVTFTWAVRRATLTDNYEFNIYDATDGDPYFYTDPPLGYTGQYILRDLPGTFQKDTLYYWDIWTYSPDGGWGVSYWAYQVTFSDILRLREEPSLARLPAGTQLHQPAWSYSVDLPPDLEH